MLILSSRHHEMRINEGALKIITRKKKHFTKIDDISLVIIRFFFFKTTLEFINILNSFCYSLFTFLPFDF